MFSTRVKSLVVVVVVMVMAGREGEGKEDEEEVSKACVCVHIESSCPSGERDAVAGEDASSDLLATPVGPSSLWTTGGRL